MAKKTKSKSKKNITITLLYLIIIFLLIFAFISYLVNKNSSTLNHYKVFYDDSYFGDVPTYISKSEMEFLNGSPIKGKKELHFDRVFYGVDCKSSFESGNWSECDCSYFNYVNMTKNISKYPTISDNSIKEKDCSKETCRFLDKIYGGKESIKSFNAEFCYSMPEPYLIKTEGNKITSFHKNGATVSIEKLD